MIPKTLGLAGIALARLTDGSDPLLTMPEALRHLSRVLDEVQWDGDVPFLRGSEAPEAQGEDAVGEALADRVRVAVKKYGREPVAAAPVLDPAGELLAMKKRLMEDRARASQPGARTLKDITTREGYLR